MGTIKAGANPLPENLDPTIEELAAANKVKPWVMAGVMKANNWAAGKRLSKEEFDRAVVGWLKSPMSGKLVEKPTGGRKE